MIVLFILGMAACMTAVAFAYRRIELLKMMVLSSGLYIILYTIVSGLLFLADAFTLPSAVSGTMLAGVISAVAFYAASGAEKPKIGLDPKRYLPLLVLIVAAFLLAFSHRSGSYDTGQDEGLYQIRAMFYMNGYYDNEIRFPEYDRIVNAWERSEYMRNLEDMDGLYLPDEEDEDEKAEGDETAAETAGGTMADEMAANKAAMEGTEEDKLLSGELHGINTFSALLALFGKLFGLPAISMVTVVCFVIMVANVWMICENMRFGRLYSFLAATVCMCSPLMLWCGMNTLNEIVIAMFLTLFFVMITEQTAPSSPLFAGIALSALCYLHMMITVMMPMLVIILLFNYLRSREKQYLISTSLLCIAYVTGFSMMWHTGERYISSNFENLFKMTDEAVNKDNIGSIATAAAVAVIAVCVVLWLRGKNSVLIKGLKQAAGSRAAGVVMRIVVVAATAASVMLYVVKIKPFIEWVDPKYLFILGFIALSGYVFVPAAVAACVIKGAEVLKDRRIFSLMLCMYYMTALICGIMWVMVREYYYFARYLAPYIFIPVVLGGYLISRLPKGAIAALGVIPVIIMIMKGSLVYTAQDKTSCSYETLERIASCVGDKDALVINEQGYASPRVFALQIKALSGADLFFMNAGDPERQARQLKNNYENVMVLSYDLGTVPKEENGWRYLYRDTASSSQYITDEEKSIPYPNDVMLIDTPTALLIYEGK